MKTLLAFALLACAVSAKSDVLQIITPYYVTTFIGGNMVIDREDFIKSVEISEVSSETIIGFDYIFADGFESDTTNWIWVGASAVNGVEFGGYGNCSSYLYHGDTLTLTCSSAH